MFTSLNDTVGEMGCAVLRSASFLILFDKSSLLRRVHCWYGIIVIMWYQQLHTCTQMTSSCICWSLLQVSLQDASILDSLILRSLVSDNEMGSSKEKWKTRDWIFIPFSVKLAVLVNLDRLYFDILSLTFISCHKMSLWHRMQPKGVLLEIRHE